MRKFSNLRRKQRKIAFKYTSRNVRLIGKRKKTRKELKKTQTHKGLKVNIGGRWVKGTNNDY